MPRAREGTVPKRESEFSKIISQEVKKIIFSGICGGWSSRCPLDLSLREVWLGPGPDLPSLPRRSPHQGGVPFFHGQVVHGVPFSFRVAVSIPGNQPYKHPVLSRSPGRSWQPAGFSSRSSGRTGSSISFIANCRFLHACLPANSFSILRFRFLNRGRCPFCHRPFHGLKGGGFEGLHCIFHGNFHCRLHLAFAERLGVSSSCRGYFIIRGFVFRFRFFPPFRALLSPLTAVEYGALQLLAPLLASCGTLHAF